MCKENITKRILKGLKISAVTDKELRLVKVKILDCKSVRDNGYEDFIGKTFKLIFAYEKRVCIEKGKTGLWFDNEEYEFV
jgi:hypothetical protein